jgi:hypothetical protein
MTKNSKLLLLSFVLLIGLGSCTKEDSFIKSETVPEVSTTPTFTKKFISDDHENDYNNYLSGNLSVAELKVKYNLGGLDVSDSDWDKIFRGTMSVTDLDTKKSSEGSLKLSDLIIKAAFYDRLPADQKTVSFEELIAHQNDLIDHQSTNPTTGVRSASQQTKYIRFVHRGNILWYYRVESRKVNYLIRDKHYNDYLMNPEIPHPVDDPYGADHNYSFSFEMEGFSPFNSLIIKRRTFTPSDYWYTYRFSSPSVTYSAWFNFFWFSVGVNPNF